MAKREPTIIDGAAVAAERMNRLKRAGQTCGLGIIVAADDPATNQYVSLKQDAAKALGWRCRIVRLGSRADQRAVRQAIDECNQEAQIDGFIVQLPLPDGVDPDTALSAVDRAKDADGLTPDNLHKLYDGHPEVIPATPRGILELLEAYRIPVNGRRVTVVGQGRLTGKPLAALLEQRGGIVTRADKSTEDLSAVTRTADVLVVATGNVDLITGDMVKPGVAVIDVGINQLEAGVTGDVEFESVSRQASAITPVPGGVGPMTVVSLLENVADIAKKRRSAG